MVTEVLQILCDQKECAVECLYNNTVVEALLQPVRNLMKGTKVGFIYEREKVSHLGINEYSVGLYF